jgi:F420-dependent oxidoreductase-like protein
MTTLSIGLKLSPQGTDVASLRAVWRVADEAGFDHVWNFDHFAAIMTDPEVDVLEGWTLLGAMAEATSRVRIGCMVTGNTYRHPAVLAKMAVTVDHLSGGRLEMGIGAAWAELEHEMFGLAFDTPGIRVARLAEACVAMKRLWTDDRASFDGTHYRLRDAIANPKPVQRPHPPLWIGGRGERKTLRVVAEHADVWNAPGGDPDEVARLSGVVDRHCADVGRDPAEIRRSVQVRYAGDDDGLLRTAAAYAERGIHDLVVIVPADDAERHAEAVAALLPRLRAAGS